MKAKLVKYPFNEKKYRWDYKEMGKTFEYKWKESLPKNYETIQPYVEAEDYNPEVHSGYSIIDNGEDFGEKDYIKDFTPTQSQIAPYVMKRIPECTPVMKNQRFAALLNDRYYDGYDEVDDRVEGVNNTFYYKLEYNNPDVNIKFYRREADVLADGLTLDDVATFTNNFNLEALAAYICNPARVRYDGSTVPITVPTNCTQTKENFVYEDSGLGRLMLWGPTDTPVSEPGRGYRDANKGTTDGLLTIELKDNMGRYWYCYAESLFMALNFYSTLSRSDGKFVNRELTKIYNFSRNDDLIYDYGTTYNYSYGENKNGVITEGWLPPVYSGKRPCFCGIDSDTAIYYDFGDIPNYGDYSGITYNEPIYSNLEVSAFYVDGVKQDYKPDHSLVMPVVHTQNNTFISWSPITLRNIARLIVAYTFDGSHTNVFQWGGGRKEYIEQTPKLPTDTDIYESLCHFRTEETSQVLWNNVNINISVYGDYDYCFKRRVFMCDFNNEFIPEKDWMEPSFTNGQRNRNGWITIDVDNTPHILLNCAYWKGTSDRDVLNRFTNRTIRNNLCNDNEPLMTEDRLYSCSGYDDIAFKFSGWHNITEDTGPYITWFRNYDYPLSYIQNHTDEFWKVKNLGVQFNSNEGLISKGFNYDYYGFWSDLRNAGMVVYTDGLYSYNKCYQTTVTKNNGAYKEPDYLYWDPDYYARLDGYWKVFSKDELVWLYKTTTVVNHSTQTSISYTEYVKPEFEAGWTKAPWEDRGDDYDYLVKLDNINYLQYDWNPICFVDSSLIPNGTFNYYSESIDLDNTKYITTPKITLKPNLILIGDKTDKYVEVPEGNETILKYTAGYAENNEFHAKQLQVNAPCEYGVDGNVLSRTWLTFNSYSNNEWQNGYHFRGTQWNNLSSPFAYLNHITDENGDREMIFSFEVCPTGKYVNALILSNSFNVSDSLDNTFISDDDTLDDYIHYWNENVGGLWYFGDGYVLSNDRNAYPDNGTKYGYSYIFEPEYTKFISYYRTDNLTNVELFSDRYTYPHTDIDLCDRTYEGTTIGDTSGTHEDKIPDANWRTYRGLYLGESIPLLGIVEQHIEPSEILGVPQYDKQVNTSDTLKYGTVASASLTFTLNKPVGETLQHNNELLILFYDFKHRDEWERLGFFRVDSIEALDENTTSLMAHDEVYKLNKYVDDFLEDYTQTTTLDLFYRDLLNYCGCFYDTHQPIIHNGALGMTNVYHAVKTTGVQVAHYVANLSPGFIHANIDGDVVLSQYQLKDDNLTIADYTNLVYTAYDTDMLNKIKIVSSNTVKGEDRGTGTNVYFLADNPLLSELQATSYFNALAQDILEVYEDIPTYRPATVDFLILPRELKIGDIVNLTTPKNETYKVIVMAMTISSSGVQIKSFGTQTYPVEAESNSEFVNLINDMGEISGDVSNMMEAQRTMATEIANNREAIGENADEIEAIKTKNTQQDTSIGNNASAISALQTLTNGFGVSVANNLATIVLNGSTPNVAMKGYVDSGDSSTLNSAKAYTDSLVGTSIGMKFGTFRWGTATSTTATNTVHCMYIGTNDKRNGIFIPTAFVANDNNRTYLFRVYNGNYYKLYDDDPSRGDVGWFAIGSVSFTED